MSINCFIKKPIKLLKIFLLVIITQVVFANTSLSKDWWNSDIDSPYLIGEGVLKVFIWEVYVLRLFSGNPTFDPSKPIVLEFEYLRDTTKKSVITASIKELRKMNTSKDKLLIWEEYLQNAISDMNKGEKAALYWQPGKQITFYVEGGSKELIKDKEFADAYINIWIGKNTTKPDLRKIITGQH